MGNFKVNLDVSGFNQYLENYAKETEKAIQEGVKQLAKETHYWILQQANDRLVRDKYALDVYRKSLKNADILDLYSWVIVLDEEAEGIENREGGMVDMKGPPGGLLHVEGPDSVGKIKTNKDGKKYRVVPMKQGKEAISKTELDPRRLSKQESMYQLIKAALKEKKIPIAKIEVDPKTGSPKTGVLHRLNIESPIPGAGNTPQLYGLTIQQVKNKKTGKIQRVMTTFRTAKEGDGKWMKNTNKMKLFQEAEKWAENHWNNNLLPQIMKAIEDNNK